MAKFLFSKDGQAYNLSFISQFQVSPQGEETGELDPLTGAGESRPTGKYEILAKFENQWILVELAESENAAFQRIRQLVECVD